MLKCEECHLRIATGQSDGWLARFREKVSIVSESKELMWLESSLGLSLWRREGRTRRWVWCSVSESKQSMSASLRGRICLRSVWVNFSNHLEEWQKDSMKLYESGWWWICSFACSEQRRCVFRCSRQS